MRPRRPLGVANCAAVVTVMGPWENQRSGAPPHTQTRMGPRRPWGGCELHKLRHVRWLLGVQRSGVLSAR
eukprot:9010209-Pyramimonas_sp.AAC.1